MNIPVVQSATTTLVREILTAARTYYVRTDGSDSNSGLSNTAGGAFLTIQRAADEVSNTLDLNAYSVTIQVADGTYNAPVSLRQYLGKGTVSLVGNTTTPANVTITTSTKAVVALDSAPWHIEGFKISTSGAFSDCLHAARSAVLTFKSIDFGACGGAHITSAYLSYVAATGNYTISGGATRHYYAFILSNVQIRSITITLTGTPAFSAEFAESYAASFLEASTVTFSGTATGTRYLAHANGVIQTGGGGANYFPGNSAGSVASGGQYI